MPVCLSGDNGSKCNLLCLKANTTLPFCGCLQKLDYICHFAVIDCMFLFLQAPLAVMRLLSCQLQILPIQGIVLCLRSLVNVVLINFGPRRALHDAVGHSC